jgi:hypothetical protein
VPALVNVIARRAHRLPRESQRPFPDLRGVIVGKHQLEFPPSWKASSHVRLHHVRSTGPQCVANGEHPVQAKLPSRIRIDADDGVTHGSDPTCTTRIRSCRIFARRVTFWR